MGCLVPLTSVAELSVAVAGPEGDLSQIEFKSDRFRGNVST